MEMLGDTKTKMAYTLVKRCAATIGLQVLMFSREIDTPEEMTLYS